MNAVAEAPQKMRRSHRAWVDPQAPRHTLYLGQSGAVSVHADRAALLVQPEGATQARVPLPRIERIVAGPFATWSGAALLACANAGVGVAFGNADGRAVGSLAPLLQRSGVLDAELTFFAEADNASDAWRDGVRALRSRLLKALWEGAGSAADGATWEAQRRQFVYQGAQPVRKVERIDARCHALVLSQLRQQGVQARYPTRHGRWIEVAADLAATLDDLRSLQAPLDASLRGALPLRARNFETSESTQRDTVAWCVLILRRSAHAHLAPWL